MRKHKFTKGQFYHIYNCGVDKRDIFSEQYDVDRFFQSMVEFNVIKPIGSIYLNSFRKNNSQDETKFLSRNLVSQKVSKKSTNNKLVNFICYCLNPNHYHFILEQLTKKGIEKFMHRLNLGYTKYFNEKYDRFGSLFQGTFKSVHIDSNQYLLHLSAYVNLNDRVHYSLEELRNLVSKSSWQEYLGKEEGICEKSIILDQFKDIQDYKKFAEASLKDIKQRKAMKKLLLEDF